MEAAAGGPGGAAGLPGPEEPGAPAEPPPEEPSGLAGPVPHTGPGEPEVPEEPAGPPGPEPEGAAPGAGGQEEEEEESGGEEAAHGTGGAAGPPEPAAPSREAAAERGAAEQRERAALLEEHRELASERERLRPASAHLQLRLGEVLRLRKGERPPREPAGPGGQRLYAERLRELRELREQRERAAAACQRRVSARQRGCQESEARAAAEWAAFQARKKALAVFTLGRQLGGRGAAVKAADCIQAKEQDKEKGVREARVENIKVKLEIQNLETVLKAQGELLKGQRFMDFEHMKKENQKLSEKFDDLSGEILKLKKKVSNTVQILSQFREKLQFVEAENQGRKAELTDIETLLSQKRDFLTKTKQARDRLWVNSLKLQQKRGLLGNDILLQDFEEKVDTIELLSQRLETLKHHHAGLILTCRGIQKKIREVNSLSPC